MVESTHAPDDGAPELINLVEAAEQKVWLLYVDSASNPGGSGAGILLWSPEGKKIEYALRFAFMAMNNEAKIRSCHMEHVPRERNQKADRLSQMGTTQYGRLPDCTTVKWVAEEAFRMKEVMDNSPDELEVYPDGWGPLPEVLSRPTTEVCHPGGRDDGGRRDAWGHQRKSPITEDPMIGNILAICSQGCPGPCPEVTDNGTQFTARKIEGLCLELDKEHRTTSMSQPQTNGQVEVMNPVIFKGVKKRIQEEGGCWDEKIPTVLWSFRTTSNPITGDALLPMEIYLETSRVSYYDELANEQRLWLNLDLLEESRVAAVDKMARYKGNIATHYNKRVRARKFLRVVGPVTYELETLEGCQVPRSWNACHLRKYYV
ncbi:hypothetical protein LIER_35798 [Lithospermum erythrorhizon]|uniref:Integrase catalytic domain-containing protein n=1 Tax=Lithospermum erythrorhizon TaxID=34254 RepID=A0AAV3P178_LITER